MSTPSFDECEIQIKKYINIISFVGSEIKKYDEKILIFSVEEKNI